MAMKDKRDSQISPVLFKFGVALAFSLGGVVYTFLRSKRIMPFKPKPSLPSPGKADSRGESCEVGDKARALQDSSLPRVSSQNSVCDLSSSGRHSGDRDGFLLPELDQLIKEYDLAKDDVSPCKNGKTLEPHVESPNEYKCTENEEHEREISCLRTKVKILEERERTLENQLLEYYGLKEQENVVVELQNRLRLHNMEAKLFNLKIESLQSENKRLQAKLADYEKVVAELESAQAKIKLLRRKLRFEAEQNREQILNLQERVMKLQDQEKKAVETDKDVETQLQTRNQLEVEFEEMEKYNESLRQENSELTQKLENLQMLATSALDNEEVQAHKEESQLLRQQNQDLRMEIEQLQAAHCTDIEELVYLRWINACLRYELRNYQPGPGETIARDLSKTLSPKSEERAKKLILEYANKEGSGDKTGISICDFDSDQWSTYLTDSGEPDDLPIDNLPDNKPNHPSKKRVFAKLMKLLRGKDNHQHVQTPPSPPELEKAVSVDDIMSRYSSNSHSGISSCVDSGADGPTRKRRTSSEVSFRHLFDLQRSYSRGQKSATTGESSNCSRRTSDDGFLSIFRSIDSIAGYDDNSSSGIQPHEDAQNEAKTELVKYAGALKSSRAKPPLRRRSAAFGSF